MTIRLAPAPLTAEAFAPFGQVIEADHARSLAHRNPPRVSATFRKH